MAFWGVEVRPGKPFTHSFDSLRGRLRISQATLADGSSPKKSLVQCNVGNKSPVLLCALLPEKTESCQLDLEFEEADEVVFSVIGPRSVHLTGYYVGNSRNSKPDDESESFGEDIANSDTMENNLSSDDDAYEDSFINDDDPEVLPPSPLSSDADESIETKKPKDRKIVHKRLKKRYQSVESDDEETSSMQQHDDTTSSKDDTKSSKAATLESESDDEFPISSIYNTKDDVKNTTEENTLFNTRANAKKTKEEKTKNETVKIFKKIAEDDVPKLKEENKAKQKKKKKEDKDTALNQESDLHHSSTIPSSEIAPDSGLKTKKKRKSRSMEEKNHITDSEEMSGNSQKSKKRRKVGKDEKSYELFHDADERKEQGQKPVTENEKKNKKKRSKNSKILENDENVNIEENNKPVKESKDKDVGIVSSKSRTLSNGLIIEDLEIGQTHGKIAAPGKKVKIHYSAILKENGHIIDSNIGKSPFRFRLGDKEVIEGWNLGLDGMRAGDKRRLVVPPTLGYGSRGTEENIPPNSWLVYDIELVSVH